jgi:hypothetical protein
LRFGKAGSFSGNGSIQAAVGAASRTFHHASGDLAVREESRAHSFPIFPISKMR